MGVWWVHKQDIQREQDGRQQRHSHGLQEALHWEADGMKGSSQQYCAELESGAALR